ncbi:aldo/keto reductase [Flavilitoribacter nigricans]|uniref:Aldo/keto reductase n=1 Tax=Flavilitoribacter nigricans (strain ATCC 23147 / DSM 23189 / NBRC 102662 / NCIMB 1420 / SS-2) TaxID=1122177 RepID=A0A2D0N2V6_FLAN2|nr:aldo/keto reductase [Flavilitoribacter nigricans]PHN02728.1 aldo/keto reductase [Flavilitoribacter nigricans DSM 23189 = NBRC 102662]
MNTAIARTEIVPGYTISRVLKGGWHLAGGHGPIQPQRAIEDMKAFVDVGITTFDCADIYSGVEELIGQFLRTYRHEFSSGDLAPVQIHTKYVPDYNLLGSLSKRDTESVIDRSLRRLGREQLDLVQFHWWDFNIPGYVEAGLHLAALQKAGKIKHLGLTNFDGAHLTEMIEAGIPVVSNQIQYSILDQRAERYLQTIQQQHGIAFLAYGSIAGGFLTDRYLDMPDPTGPLENRSLTKYRLIIEEFGDWAFFQATLKVLRSIADKYEVGIAEVAAQWVLQRPLVAGVIIGARNRHHLDKLKSLTRFSLQQSDLEIIQRQIDRAEGPSGPVYGLERDKNGRHGRIMKYNLNRK